MSQWLRSSKASTIFLYSAWIVVCMGVFVIFMLTPWFQQIEALPKGEISLLSMDDFSCRRDGNGE